MAPSSSVLWGFEWFEKVTYNNIKKYTVLFKPDGGHVGLMARPKLGALNSFSRWRGNIKSLPKISSTIIQQEFQDGGHCSCTLHGQRQCNFPLRANYLGDSARQSRAQERAHGKPCHKKRDGGEMEDQDQISLLAYLLIQIADLIKLNWFLKLQVVIQVSKWSSGLILFESTMEYNCPG